MLKALDGKKTDYKNLAWQPLNCGYTPETHGAVETNAFDIPKRLLTRHIELALTPFASCAFRDTAGTSSNPKSRRRCLFHVGLFGEPLRTRSVDMLVRRRFATLNSQ